MQRRVAVRLLALFLLCAYTAKAQSKAPQFRWLDEVEDKQLWAKLQSAFAAELKPDDPEKVKSAAAYLHKYITQAGIVGDAALVFVAHRETRDSDPLIGEWVSAYSCDLQGKQKKEILLPTRLYRFSTQLAQFEPDKPADVVLYYVDCTECEAGYLASALRFDVGNRTWALRDWVGEGGKDSASAIMTGSDSQDGDNLLEYESIYKVGDFDGDGLDDIVVWVREIEKDWEAPNKELARREFVNIYSVKNGKALGREIKGTEAHTLRARLCKEFSASPLCTDVSPAARRSSQVM